MREEGLGAREGAQLVVHASFAIGGHLVPDPAVLLGGTAGSQHSISKIRI